ncbi:MAG: alpha/beta hydrolase family protein [Hyphomicrobiaceae bacterium]
MPEIFPQREVPPPAPAELSDSQRNELDAHRRAMPLQRLLDNGVEYADAVAWHGLAERGVRWVDAGVWLAETQLRRAEAARAAGHPRSACIAFRHASACFRFAQSALTRDDDSKRALYRRLIDAFSAAAVLDPAPILKLEIPFSRGPLFGWLLEPSDGQSSATVIVFGGADGWREAYFTGAAYLLERGLSVLLLDGPGQGETRLFGGVHLDIDYAAACSAALEHLQDKFGKGPIGIWGNSMGGHLAAMAVARDARFAACCVNGGSIRPLETLDRFPRFIDKLAAMVGTTDAGRVLAVMRHYDLTSGVDAIRCPLLVLHGGADLVFLPENGRRIYTGASSQDKTMLYWDDGDHCLYNHAHEKNCIVSDWFHDRLAASVQARDPYMKTAQAAASVR